MPSPLFVSLQQALETLKGQLIVQGKDYDQYTSTDHTMALGFRVLASAQMENYAERRCLEVATEGVARLQKRLPTRAGHALVLSYVTRKDQFVPLNLQECPTDDRAIDALNAYRATIESSHGVSGRKLRLLVVRLGLQEPELKQQLFDNLDLLAEARGAAAHIRVNRAKGMREPLAEWTDITTTLPLLQDMDDTLQAATG